MFNVPVEGKNGKGFGLQGRNKSSLDV